MSLKELSNGSSKFKCFHSFCASSGMNFFYDINRRIVNLENLTNMSEK